jgi:diguanylate cyclase (GGDEF)-like protein
MQVLIAHNDLATGRLLEASLTDWGYETVVAVDGAEARQLLMAADGPQMAVLDWPVAGVNGEELCAEVRRSKPGPYAFLLLLADEQTVGGVVHAIESGADDYLRKPVDLQELKVRLNTAKKMLFLQRQLSSARDALRDQTTHDLLTGVWNRAALLDLLETELGRARRQGTPVSVIMVDVDFFKLINESHGHATADDVLRKVGLTIRDSTRRYDSVGRYGGEVFMLILPGCDQINAVAHAERLRQAISQIAVKAPTAVVRATASLGVSVSDNEHRPDCYDLVQAAEMALAHAKKAGRNRVELKAAENLLTV